jgi:hypothetical protein
MSYLFTNLWFLANPNPVHGMGESDSKTFYSLEPGSYQSNLMALTIVRFLLWETNTTKATPCLYFFV